MEKIPVCIAYEIDGKTVTRFPFPAALAKATPIIRYFDGWMCDISAIRKWKDLPEAAKVYLRFIEETIACPIRYISVGAERESIIIKNKEEE